MIMTAGIVYIYFYCLRIGLVVCIIIRVEGRVEMIV